MARLYQLSDLRTEAYRLADCENATGRFPAAEVNSYVNIGVADFYDLLVRSNGEYFQKNTTIVTDGVKTVYGLPQDFYRLILAQVNLAWMFNYTTSDINIPLFEFNMFERPQLSSSAPGLSGSPFAYHISTGGDVTQAGTTQGTIPVQYCIEFLPKPSTNVHVDIFYVPTCPVLVNDNDTLDSINGWHTYATAYAARLMRLKDDLPDTMQVSLMADLKEKIVGMAPKRDTAYPRRVTDIRGPAFLAKRWRRGRYTY